jgi:hypothetical protein
MQCTSIVWIARDRSISKNRWRFHSRRHKGGRTQARGALCPRGVCAQGGREEVRITGQLTDAATGAHIWADRFERDLTHLFASPFRRGHRGRQEGSSSKRILSANSLRFGVRARDHEQPFETRGSSGSYSITGQSRLPARSGMFSNACMSGMGHSRPTQPVLSAH